MRRERTTCVAGAVLAGLLLASCGSGPSDSPTRTPTPPTPSTPVPGAPTASAPAAVHVPIDAVAVTDGGLGLAVQALGGGCRRLALQAQESSAEVRLTLTVTRPPGICPPYVTLVEVTTTLHAPLGDRRLVDTATGRTILPQTPSGVPSHMG